MVGNRGFVRPMPMSDDAFDRIVQLTRVKTPSAPDAADAEHASAPPPFSLDDFVEVLEGPFKGMKGPVLDLVDDGAQLTLALTVMGRDTPVTLASEHCELCDAAV